MRTKDRILYTTFEHARTVRDAIPGSRIVGYQRGYAIQLRRSGPYVLVSDVARKDAA